jgi:hypothetical protein
MAISVRPSIVTSGLVLNLDAANMKSYPRSGTTWRDLSGLGNNGTLTNGPTFNSANGGSIVFDGTNDFVTGSDSSNFAFGTGNFTVGSWFFSLSSVGILVDLRSNSLGNGPGFSDYFLNNKFYLYWNSANRYQSTGSIDTSKWYNVVTTRQSSTVSVYINGILDGTTTDNTNLTEGGFRLARNINTTGTGYLNGSISNVRIYNRALSAQEVQQNYNATKTRFGLQ